MKVFGSRAFLGICGLLAAGFVANGCGSSNSSSGKGGASGSAGSTGTGGASSAGAGGAHIGCSMSDAPASATIADFSSADGGLEVLGGIVTYGGISAPMYSLTGGALQITEQVVTGAAIQYVGLVIYFNGNPTGTDCVDATAYTGIQFDISGTLTGPGCTVQYSTNDAEHETNATDDPKGYCAKADNCYAPQLPIPSLMSAPVTTKVDFAGGATTPGNPAVDIDKTKITGVQWQLTVPAAADGGPPECDLALTIDNVKFY